MTPSRTGSLNLEKLSKSQLQAVKEIWYGKLKDEGFKDIETVKNDLKLCHSSYYPARFNPVYFWQKHEYYYASVHFLESHAFDDKTEKVIWKYHSEGVSVRAISTILNKSARNNAERFNKDEVSMIIRRLRTIMQKCVMGGSDQNLDRPISRSDEACPKYGSQLHLFDVA